MGAEDSLVAEGDAVNALEVFGLQKVFNKRGLLGRLCCRPSREFWSIRDSWFLIEKNQLFCLLG
jgi:hypothetical protein